jgi:hypothetical protein
MNLKKIEKFIHDLKTNEHVITIVIVAVFYFFVGISDFWKEPVASIIVLFFVYLIAYVIASVVVRMQSDSYPVFDGEVKAKLEEIIINAKDHLYLVSPYLSPGNVLIEKILNKARDGVKVVVVINSNQLQSFDVHNFYERLLPLGGEMYHHPRLHAKLYLNEKECMVSSLNLLTSSFDNSFEVGTVSDDKYTRKEVVTYIKNTLLASDLTGKVCKESFQITHGFCIRTRQRIAYNPLRPIEYNEYRSNTNSSNAKGQYCHVCGEKAETSLDTPFCERHR